MAQGIEVFDTSGRLQVSSDMLGYVLTRYGTATSVPRQMGSTTPSSLLVPVGGNFADRFVAISVKGAFAGLVGIGPHNGSPHAIYACSAPVGHPFSYFAFERASNLPPINSGLEVKNAAGQITFSSNARPMIAVGMLDYSVSSHGWAYWYGQPSSLSKPGRVLAFAQCAMGGHRIANNVACWDSGAPRINFNGPCLDRRFQNEGRVYGCRISDAGDAVSSGTISFDDAQVALEPGQDPPIDWFNPLKAFVIDVTNIAPPSQ